MALPVPREIDARTLRHGQLRHADDLLAIGHVARIFPEGRFLGVAKQVRAADVVVVANLAAMRALGVHTVRLHEPD